MKSVLITGVGGFLGSHFAESFLNKNYEVIGIDNFIDGYFENVPVGVQNFEPDLDDLDLIVPFFEGVDMVVHNTCTSLIDDLTQLANRINQKGAKHFNYHLPIEFVTQSTPETWAKN
jgi:nucleoside-diphosphate-sugar epimerase